MKYMIKNIKKSRPMTTRGTRTYLELLQVSTLDHVLVVAAMPGVAASVLHHLESPRESTDFGETIIMQRGRQR